MVRNYASHKDPLLTLTDWLFLFSIFLPRAPDAGMKSPVMWDENSWHLLTMSQPKHSRKAAPHRSGGTEFDGDASLHQAPNEGCFFTGLYTLSHSAGVPWYAWGQIHLGSVLTRPSPGRKARRAGHETSLKPQYPGYPSPPQAPYDTSRVNSCQTVANVNFTREQKDEGYS